MIKRMKSNANVSFVENEDMMPPIINLQMHNFMVVENKKHNRIELNIRGEIPGPEKVADEIATLYQYAEEYGTLLIYINTPGGGLNTLIEILSAVNKFDCVITVGCGEVASAGFILWCSGDIRVVQPYTMFMAHRESYGGAIGKTDQHIEHAAHINQIGTRIITETCGDVLTENEIERCKYTEVFFSDQDVLEREACISWETFIVNDTTPIEWNVYFTKDDTDYHAVGEQHVMFESGTSRFVANTYDIIYDTPNPFFIEVMDGDAEGYVE